MLGMDNQREKYELFKKKKREGEEYAPLNTKAWYVVRYA